MRLTEGQEKRRLSCKLPLKRSSDCTRAKYCFSPLPCDMLVLTVPECSGMMIPSGYLMSTAHLLMPNEAREHTERRESAGGQDNRRCR